MSEILDKLDIIVDPFRRDVVNAYSATMCRMIENEVPGALESLVKDMRQRCPGLTETRREFKKYLQDERQWMNGFLYLAISEHAKKILGE